jgi:hypothetical protein
VLAGLCGSEGSRVAAQALEADLEVAGEGGAPALVVRERLFEAAANSLPLSDSARHTGRCGVKDLSTSPSCRESSETER